MSFLCNKILSAWLPPGVWAAGIFFLSNTPDLSSGLEYDFALRKVAHVSEYLILTLLVGRALRMTSRLGPRQLPGLTAVLSFLYAVSDEFHQLFVPGRQGSPVDVGIDSIGVALAVFWLLQKGRVFPAESKIPVRNGEENKD
ncbi:MAG: VanZ family protein [Candidatus Omnitrophica bacterium]|nr:VanZ family protein [Candidatus Omnitrophota bacterium]